MKSFADDCRMLCEADLDEIQNNFSRLCLIVSQEGDGQHFTDSLDDVLLEIIAIQEIRKILEDLPSFH